MFFDGYIGAPPTCTVFSCAESGASAVPDRARAATAAAIKAKRLDMVVSPKVASLVKAANRRRDERDGRSPWTATHFVVGPSYAACAGRFRGRGTLTVS